MANYDNRLAEWFKQLEKKEQELRDKKQGPEPSGQKAAPTPEAQDIESFEIREPAGKASASVISSIDSAVLAGSAPPAAPEADAEEQSEPWATSPRDEALPASDSAVGDAPIFDEAIPQVEDFLAFLNRPLEPQPALFEPPVEQDRPLEQGEDAEVAEETGKMPEAESGILPEMESLAAAPVEEPQKAVVESPEQPAPPKSPNNGGRAAFRRAQHVQPVREQERPSDQPLTFPPGASRLHLVEEGTGEPLPVSELMRVEPEQETVQPEPAAVQIAAQEPVGEQPEITAAEIDEFARPAAAKTPQPVAKETGQTQAQWDRVPRHLQTLFASSGEEVAQGSYKTFKETRADLIQRLLDPVITLEEAARVLNVCPTTVRRYTNRGTLTHIRTAGNQRRFRLSDVLAFMETSAGSTKTAN